MRHDNLILEGSHLARFIFAGDEFQAVGAGRENHSSLVDEIAASDLLELLLVEVNGDRVAQRGDGLP